MSAPAEPGTVLRFSRAVRWVHWTAGGLTLVCIATAAILYNGSLAVLFGDRRLVELIHVYSGFALVGPLLLGLAARSYRADLRRLNRFSPDDWRWLRTPTRRDGRIPVGKFNAGQKLNGALSGGALAVLLLSGTVMYLTGVTTLAARTGATFVHDWFALGLGLLVAGHLTYALRDSAAMRGMRTGVVGLLWARREHGAWAAEITGSTVPGSTVPGSTVPGSTVPGSTVPGSTVPGSTVTGAALTPEQAGTAPAAGTPGHSCSHRPR